MLDPIIEEVSYKQSKIKIEMPAKGLEVPKEGFSVVVEHLFIEENMVEETVHLQLNDSIKIMDVKQKRYAPIFKGIVEKVDESFSYYMSVNGWKKYEC